ncbi:uncharacterized protein [Nicotiana sylvestris]|uniref:uncharacterized protein n=1 Tax=Nicotiana sylvestris TaxID=4096 RepID=UPI00388CB322
MSVPWSFVSWSMDVIRPIEPATSNGHIFILVVIAYFTKWVKAKTFRFVTKKAVVDFVHSNIICRFGIPKVIFTNNGASLNSHLMKEVYGKEAVIPTEVEIPSLRIVAEAEIDDDEWVKTRLEQLSLIDEKSFAAMCRGQLYQKRMARAYNKKAPTWRARENNMSFKNRKYFRFKQSGTHLEKQGKTVQRKAVTRGSSSRFCNQAPT